MATFAEMFLRRGGSSESVLEAAKTASMEAAMWALTANTNLPYGFYDPFSYDTQLPVMTGETTLGTTITATSFLTSLNPWRVADGINSTAGSWVASAAPTPSAVQSLRISRTTTSLLTRYNIWTRNDASYVYSPNSWVLYSSTAETVSYAYVTESAWAAAAEWTAVHSVSGKTVNTPNTKLGDYVLATPVQYKHLALVITAANGGASRVSIGELNIYHGGIDQNSLTNATIANGKIMPTTIGGSYSKLTLTSGMISSTDSHQEGYPPSNVVDDDSGTIVSFTSGTASLIVDLGTSQQVGRVGLSCGAIGSYPATSFVLYGSSNGTDWTEIDSESGFTLGGTEQTFDVASGTYRYFKITISRSASYVQLGELELYSGTPATVNEATIISTADTASAAPSYAMGLMWLDEMGATVTNATETNNAIRLYVSRDNGSTWDWFQLTDKGAVSGDVHLYACDQKTLSATSGTSIKLKLTSHDLGSGAPNFELHGWGVVYDEGA